MSLATDLSSGDPLPDGDEFVRYCSSQHLDDDNVPLATAFVRRPQEPDLSGNRLQAYVGQSRSGAVDCIRDEVRQRITVRRTGRFAVVNVGQVKSAACAKACALRIIYTPDGGPSHSSIAGLPKEHTEEVRVATAIMRLVNHDYIFDGLP